MNSSADVLIIGSGIIGLTTAICLTETGMRVRIRTAALPENTTSMLASAMVGPNLDPPGDRTHRWQQETIRRLSDADSIPGVTVRSGRLVARPKNATPPGAEQTPGYRPCTPEDLPVGYQTCFWVTLPVVDMPPYLEHLRARFEEAGGRIELRPVGSLGEATTECPRVVNCTGLAARTIVPDEKVYPMRGVKVVVANPGLETFFLEAPINPEWATYIPHSDVVVLGGVQRESDDETLTNAEVSEIVARCAAIEPKLADAPIVQSAVGLRPARESVRLEAQRSQDIIVVHNYGHGGSGVMYSWGCALECAELLTS